MTDIEFCDFWDDVHEFFGLDSKAPAKRRSFDRVFEYVKHVPAEALPLITRRLKDLENLPRNMGKAILSGWLDWKSKNPDRLVGEQGGSKGCPFCEGGNIFVISRKEGCVPRTTFFPCGHCRAGGHTRAAIEDMGWEITNPKWIQQTQQAPLELPYEGQQEDFNNALEENMRSPEQAEMRFGDASSY